MGMMRPGGHHVRATLLAAMLLSVSVGCSGGAGTDATARLDQPGGPSSTAGAAPSADPGTSGTAAAAGPQTTGAGPGSTSSTGTETTAPPGDSATLADASTGPRSAPGVGDATALLRSVRVGRSDGYERIVFEFEGASRPGYRIQWVDGPILADGSGDRVDVEGSAYLQVIMEPASGVDLDTGRVTYAGADRVDVEEHGILLKDLVRTGDFEAVLTWAVGADRAVPFRVLTLQAPTRLVIDLATE